MSAPVFKIVPGLQSYAWGKKGSSSLAAQLGSSSIPDFEIDGDKPYAEVCPCFLCYRVVLDGQTIHHTRLYMGIEGLS